MSSGPGFGSPTHCTSDVYDSQYPDHSRAQTEAPDHPHPPSFSIWIGDRFTFVGDEGDGIALGCTLMTVIPVIPSSGIPGSPQTTSPLLITGDRLRSFQLTLMCPPVSLPPSPTDIHLHSPLSFSLEI